MKYGFFDEQNREYVITKPDTPAPWANYLGSPAYGAIISNNAGGYSFVESGANGRISRYHFMPTINQADIFTYATTIRRIIGQPPGSRWARIFQNMRASAATVPLIP
jgi:cellobiose phosphorylase